jgi:preprotein translocase subunit SecY
MFRVAATSQPVGGTLFLMWIGEQITSRGIGNGISLIIMAGIVAQLPRTALAQASRGRPAPAPCRADLMGVLALARPDHGASASWSGAAPGADPISQAPTARGRCRPERSHLPLKINTAGVIPPIFASSLLLMPLTIAPVSPATAWRARAHGETG